MKIISVIPFKKGVPRGDLTYFTSLQISVGDAVCVPIRSRKTLALVVSCEELKDSKALVKTMDFNLRKVIEGKGHSVFLNEYLDAIVDTSKYFAQSTNLTTTVLIPNVFIEYYDKILNMKKAEKNVHSTSKNLRNEKLILQCALPERISAYKTLIRESFARGESVFVVVPMHIYIEEFVNQLSKGIERFTFSFSSATGAKKNLVSYEQILNSSHPVLIIGTTPFLSIPRDDTGTIILEHENSNAYRMDRGSYFDLRVFVEIYASKIEAKFIMADNTLRYETIGRQDIDNLNPLLPLSFRLDFAGKIEVAEPRSKGVAFKIFADASAEQIRDAHENKKSVFIFSLRKGLATETVCRDCAETLICEKCGAPLVLHLSHQGTKRMFVCNRCENTEDSDTVCGKCGSWNLVPLGIGTDRVFEEMQKLFPDRERAKIFQIDKDSVKTVKAANQIIEEFEKNPGSILVGTEMALLYITKKVPLSIVASFDSLWSIPSFKICERSSWILQLLIGITIEKLIIQTRNVNERSLLSIKSENLLSFVREELADRHRLGYPPYKRFIKIVHLGDKAESLKSKEMLANIFEEYSPVIFTGFVERLKGKYVTNALIKMDPKKWSLPEISSNSSLDEHLLNKLLSLPLGYEVFVDPENLL